MGRAGVCAAFLLLVTAVVSAADATCSLSGRVVDDRGRGVTGAAVTVLLASPAMADPIRGTTTAPDGSWCITDLAAGTYRVRAVARMQPPSASPSCTDCCGPSSEFVPTLHRKTVSVRPVPRSPSWVELVMQSVPSFCVRGEVRDRGGKLMPRVGISVEGDALSASVFNEGGRFLLTSLPSGSYTVAITQSAQAPSSVVHRHRLRVEGRSLSGVVVVVP